MKIQQQYKIIYIDDNSTKFENTAKWKQRYIQQQNQVGVHKKTKVCRDTS